MLIIVKNTEEVLYNELKTCRDKFPTQRCLYLKFSALGTDKEEWISFFFEEAKTFFESDICHVYICEDSDVFVLSRTLSHRAVEKFLKRLNLKIAFSELETLSSLHEVGVDWNYLRELCEKKIELIEITQREKVSAKTDAELCDLTPQLTLNELNKDLLMSLSMRRQRRKTPEILVVEDDPFSQRLVGNALSSDYSLSMTDHGASAIVSYVNKAPDVMFLDIGLPDIDGYEVLERVFLIDPEAYVVMFSGNGNKDNILRAIELGAKGFVGKPFTKDKLFQYVEKSPFIQAKKKENLYGNLVN